MREVQKPLHAAPLKQEPLHRHVRSFAETGRLVAGSQAYQQAFVALRKTALGRRILISDNATKSRLFVTEDFTNVVKIPWGEKPMDEYSRPVHWILWSMITETALIVSDFEADALIPFVRDQPSPPSTHLITYAAPVTRAMVLTFDTLTLYTVPPLPPNSWHAPTWLVRDLGIFAGRLYFNYHDQAHALYQALGLPPPPLASSSQTTMANDVTELDHLESQLPLDDALPPNPEETKPDDGPFCQNPLLFMQEWLAIRRKGQDFSQSMMGQLIRGSRLEEGDWKEKEKDATLGGNVQPDSSGEDLVKEEDMDSEGDEGDDAE